MKAKYTICWAFLIAAISLFPKSILFAEISSSDFFRLMKEKDQTSQAVGYKISFVMATEDNQFKDPNQGMVFMNCESTWISEDTFAMKITYDYEHPPVYGRIGTRNYAGYDYDNGNLIVWRTLEKYILSSPERNDTLEKVKVFFVDPNNRVVETDDNIKVHRFKSGDTNNRYQFNQFELATGRGFSKHLMSNVSVISQPPHLTEVTAQDSWQGVMGNWKLTLDPNSDNLIREAVFTESTAARPSVKVTTSGVIERDGIKMAKSGKVKYSSGLELNIELTEISKIIGTNELYEEVSSFLNNSLPKGASIIDMRGGTPARSTVE